MKIVFDDGVEKPVEPEAEEELEEEDEELELDGEDIDEMEANLRRDNVRQFTTDYIMQLIDADASCSAEEVGLDDETVELILDGFEEILAAYGFLCYRPVVTRDDDGKRVIAYSQYEEELGGY